MSSSTQPLDRMQAICRVVAGLEPLGGARSQLRVTYSGTWDGPFFITLTVAGEGGDVVIVDPGEDFRSLVMAALAGRPPMVSPTRRETRARLSGDAATSLGALLDDASLWTFGDGDIRGNDGHWISLEVFSPRRGFHAARDWCPSATGPLGRAAGIALRIAATTNPALAEYPWVSALWPPRP